MFKKYINLLILQYKISIHKGHVAPTYKEYIGPVCYYFQFWFLVPLDA